MALTIGVPYETFWHLTPKKLKAFYKSYKQKRKIEDEKMWYMGQYIMSALDSTVCNNSFWKGKHGTASKYFKEPLFSHLDKPNEGKYKESNEEIAVFEMKKRTNLLLKSGLQQSPS